MPTLPAKELIERNRFNPALYVWVILFSVGYLLWIGLTSEIRGDHIALVVLVNLLFLVNDATRRFLYGFSIFIFYWILYDSMKLYPNYEYHSVNIAGIHDLELKIFGLSDGGKLVTPNEYLSAHAAKGLDMLCGFFYLCWIPVPLLFAYYLYLKNKQLFLRYSLAFLVTNLLGFVVYYCYPVAPPWYFMEYGTVIDPSIKSNAAGLLRVDNMTGIPIFQSIYSKGSNVFAAMPSLHSAYPLVGFYYSLKLPNRRVSIFLGIITTGIWFAAVYLDHHYVLDVIAGIACAVLGILLLEKIILKQPRISRILQSFTLLIEK